MTILKDNQDNYLAEINVTPFVDVLLVLLVLFIVTLPIAIQTLSVKLPSTNINNQPAVLEPIYISVNKDGIIIYNDIKISIEQLIENLKNFDKINTTVVIQADQVNKYGLIVDILSSLRQEGFEKVGLSVEQVEK